MEEEFEQSQSKINFLETFLVLAVAATADLTEDAGLLLLTIPVVGLPIGVFLVSIAYILSGGLLLWSLFRTGGPSGVSRLGSKVGLWGLGTLLSLRVFSYAIAIWLHNHPKFEGAVKSAANLSGKL